MSPLDTAVGRVRVRCFEAATRDLGDAPATLGMVPGDLLLQFRGLSGFVVVKQADRDTLARALACPVMADPDKHRERHVDLHQRLDELVADWIQCDPEPFGPNRRSLRHPILALQEWSCGQVEGPLEEPRS